MARGRPGRGRSPRITRGQSKRPGRTVPGPVLTRNPLRVAVVKDQVATALAGKVHTRAAPLATRRATPAPVEPERRAETPAEIVQGPGVKPDQPGLNVARKRNCKMRPDSRVNRGQGAGRPFVPYCKGS